VFDKPPRYRFFLLACWEETGQNPINPTRWRFSLQDPRTGERQGFPDLEALVAALQSELEAGGSEGKN
jgi:hypothetical protein